MSAETFSSEPEKHELENIVKKQSSEILGKLAQEVELSSHIQNAHVVIDGGDLLHGTYRGICRLKATERNNTFTDNYKYPKVYRDSINSEWKLDREKYNNDMGFDTRNFKPELWKPIILPPESRIEIDSKNPLAGRFKGTCKLRRELPSGQSSIVDIQLTLKNPLMRKCAVGWELDYEKLSKESHVNVSNDWTAEIWEPKD